MFESLQLISFVEQLVFVHAPHGVHLDNSIPVVFEYSYRYSGSGDGLVLGLGLVLGDGLVLGLGDVLGDGEVLGLGDVLGDGEVLELGVGNVEPFIGTSAVGFFSHTYESQYV